MLACLHTYTHVHTWHTSMYRSDIICIHMLRHVCMYTHMHTHIESICYSVHTHTHRHTDTHTHTHRHTHRHTHTVICTHTAPNHTSCLLQDCCCADYNINNINLNHWLRTFRDRASQGQSPTFLAVQPTGLSLITAQVLDSLSPHQQWQCILKSRSAYQNRLRFLSDQAFFLWG